MHPFGGTQYCPRCSKPVYAAEQVMGPGRNLYHKPCLACMSCNKRLDSYTLLEHDQMPYCKSCHIKNFANRDLRQANLPHYDVTPSASPPSSSPASSPMRGSRNKASFADGVSVPRLRHNISSAARPASDPYLLTDAELNEASLAEYSPDIVDESSMSSSSISHPPHPNPPQLSVPTNTGRPGLGGIPRTVPLSPNHANGTSTQSHHHNNNSVHSNHTSLPKEGSNRFAGAPPTGAEKDTSQRQVGLTPPLVRMPTGTRYGAALGSAVGVQITGGGSPSKWGTGTPSCPRCGKSVYFAEQVKAVGKTYHKGCLRCTECSTLLDSSRLRDHDGDPLCVRCYGKLHGPQGAGYALLGKAGG